MKIRSQSETKLVLQGIPGSARWLIFALLLGLLFSLAFGWLAWREFKEGGFGYTVVMCGCGVALGQLFFWTGAVTLAVGRETLELDKAAPAGVQGGRYCSRSPIVTVPKSFDFELAAVHAVSLERLTEQHPSGRQGAGGEVDVFRARLLITKPRRALALDETSNHRDERVQALGRAVAKFLQVPVEESDLHRK